MATSTCRGVVTVRAQRILCVVVACAAIVGAPRTANAQAYVLDHFMCYTITGSTLNQTVRLRDQFNVAFLSATVVKPAYLCNPTVKVHNNVRTPIRHPNAHLEWYSITTATSPKLRVVVANQFNPAGAAQTLTVNQARWLAVPTQKAPHEPPLAPELDHFKCYSASGPAVPAALAGVALLQDQFEADRDFLVLRPLRFCNPVVKVHNGQISELFHEDDHLVCYDVARLVNTRNQFREEKFYVRKMSMCVPSRKLSWAVIN